MAKNMKDEIQVSCVEWVLRIGCRGPSIEIGF